jgi:hypothetical protein
MTDQQLYIDGILMDMSEETAITLDIKSNLFRDITKMTANTTYTINLPKGGAGVRRETEHKQQIPLYFPHSTLFP